MIDLTYKVSTAVPEEYPAIGRLLTEVYSQLEGFPKENEQPEYYKLLSDVQAWAVKPGVEILVVRADNGQVLGAVIYFSDMQYYGSGGTATSEKNSAGFRLLAVDPSARGKGIGKLLAEECILKAKQTNRSQLIIHTTSAMQIALRMYESLGFRKAPELDFEQGKLQVWGLKLDW